MRCFFCEKLVQPGKGHVHHPFHPGTIVVVDDVAGLGHTLKRSLKLISPLFPATEILTAVLVDVARIRLADRVDPDAAAMTTDILNIRFPWGSPDFSRYLRKETKNV